MKHTAHVMRTGHNNSNVDLAQVFLEVFALAIGQSCAK